MNRREFLVQAGAAAGIAAGGLLTRATAAGRDRRSVALICDPGDPVAAGRPPQWALGRLQEVLTKRGVAVRTCSSLEQAGPSDFCVIATGSSSSVARDAGALPPAVAEGLLIAFANLGGREAVVAAGHDARGLTYALAELADRAAPAADPLAALRTGRRVREQPVSATRSIMRCFVSDVEDKAWYYDREFWRSYLSHLASQRYNRFNLALGLGYDSPSHLRDTYFYFPYPFLLAVPGYGVRVTHLPDSERDRNLEMLRFVSDEAGARGLHFQLGLWTHAYRWANSPGANHVIQGLTDRTQAAYSRDALALLLKECPNIGGVTFRIHGESGVPEGSYDFWRTVFAGCVRSGRRIEIDMHAKGMDQPTLDIALATGLPVTVSPKFWAEHLGMPYHQAAIRELEEPHQLRGAGAFAESEGARSFLRYGYGDLLREDRPYRILYRIWPGTQKVLLSGDPIFGAGYGRAATFCGGSGIELFDPLSFKGREGSGLPGGRDGYADLALRAPGGDFEKYRYPILLWGRLLYDPRTDPEAWRRRLRADHGRAAEAVENALGAAARILPIVTTAHLPSAANNNYWPEMYVNQEIVEGTLPPGPPYTDTPSPKRFGTVSPLDPQLFSRVEDFADELRQGRVGGKYSPVEVAQWLEDLAESAAASLRRAEARAVAPGAAPFRRMAIDVGVQIGLGRFFGRKLRAAVLYALYRRTDDTAALKRALSAYRSARNAWAGIVATTAGVYVADLSYGDLWYKRGNWADRLVAIDRDIAAMESRAWGPAAPAVAAPTERIAALIAEVEGRPAARGTGVTHHPPSGFRRGRALALTLGLESGAEPLHEAQLHYRHTQQAEAWRSTPMAASSGCHTGEIPGAYTDSPYPLQYYFEVRRESGRPWLHPGFAADLANQPYFVVASS